MSATAGATEYYSTSEACTTPAPGIMLTAREGLFSRLIRKRTRGPWSHVMLHLGGLQVASQELFYHQRLADEVSRPGYRIWLYESPLEIWPIIRQHAGRRLGQRWHQRLYDWLGVVGHALGLRWLHIPSRYYCSEDVAQVLAAIQEHYAADDTLCTRADTELLPPRRCKTPSEVADWLERLQFLDPRWRVHKWETI